MTTSLSLVGVSKNFGGAHALTNIDLSIAPGRIHALVGENGAGKSTATRILAGLEHPTSGSIVLAGEPVEFHSRAAAIRHGIGLVPQQVGLIEEFTLIENFLLTQPRVFTDRRGARRALAEAAERAGLAVNLAAPIATLGLAERQLGELAIALAQGATTLLLDEPTSALGPFETVGLFERIKTLATSGVGVLLITHRLDEVRHVADHVTVLSHGRVVLDDEVAAVTDAELVDALVSTRPPVERKLRLVGETIRLSRQNVSARSDESIGIYDVSLDVRHGEILGVLGVAGNGQRTLADAASGTIQPHAGTVTVDEVAVTGQPARARAAGLAYVPESRPDAILPDAPATWSAIVTAIDGPRFIDRSRVNWKKAREFTRSLLERHDVRPRNPDLRAGAFSGGNQQKLLVGRELDSGASVAVLHAPTQGLDINASAAIRGEITNAAAHGTAVLLISADIDEVRELADRVIVLAKGSVSDSFPIADFTTQRVGRAMAGLSETAS